jgi:hypothetical protein
MKRMLRIDPNVPDRVETLKAAAGTWSSNDIGKAVKLDGDNVTLCADQDEIYGFISAVEPYTKDGDRVAAVACDTNRETYATDEDGTLAVGDLVVAGTPTAVGTAFASGALQNVVVHDTTTDPNLVERWKVMAVYATGAGSKVLIRKI